MLTYFILFLDRATPRENFMTSSSPRVQRLGSVICYMHAGQHLLKVSANSDAFVTAVWLFSEGAVCIRTGFIRRT